MIRAAVVMAALLAAPGERIKVSTVECKTVDECWLDDGGAPVARPKKFKGQQFPKGDCGRNLIWLRTRIRCEVPTVPDAGSAKVCVTENIGDKC